MTTFSPTTGTHGANRFLASRLVGIALGNGTDTATAAIDDLVIDSDNWCIAYAAVAFGGFLGVGSKHFAMPWNLIDVREAVGTDAVHATTDVARETFAAAPGFAKDDWPDAADARWALRLEGNYRPGQDAALPARFDDHGRRVIDLGVPEDGVPAVLRRPSRRLAELIGKDVVDLAGEPLATVEDLIVDVRRGTVDGVVLAFGGAHGVRECFALVPAAALTIARDANAFALDSTPARLGLMALPEGPLPPLDSDDWLVGSRERLAMARDAAARDAAVVAAPPAAEPHPNDARFGGPVEHVRGTVMTLGASSREQNGAARLRLRVRTPEGREAVVLAGRVDDPNQAALALRSGLAVDCVGWRVHRGTQSVLVARSITGNGKTVEIAEGPRSEISIP